MEYEFSDIPKAIYEAKKKCAESWPQYRYLKEMKEVTLFRLMNQYPIPDASEAEKKRYAKSHPDYIKAIEELKTASRAYETDQAHLIARQAELEVQRSIQSTKRAEMQLI